MTRLAPFLIIIVASAILAGSGCVPFWLYHRAVKTNEDYVETIDGLEKEHANLVRNSEEAISKTGRLEIENKVLKEKLQALEPRFLKTVEQLKEALKGGIQKVGFTAEESKDVKITDDGKISIAGDVLFALGKASLTTKAKEILRKLAPVLLSNIQGAYLRIEGHTDDVPIKNPKTKEKFPTNWHLSTARAMSVLLELKDLKIPESRMYAAGYGEFKPRVPNKPGKKGHKENRRVEIAIVSGK